MKPFTLCAVALFFCGTALAQTEVKITAADAAAGDLFGYSVSIDGDTVVVGAQLADAAGFNSGSAYIFGRNQGGADAWGQVAKLKPSDGATGDYFGISVSINGDTAVVGASGDRDAGDDSGSAYIFGRNQGGADAWGQITKLTASDAAAHDHFGISVSIDGDTAVVGAHWESSPFAVAVGENGSAYIFDRNQGGADTWGEVAKLTASDAAMFDRFGYSVSINGDTVVVGAYGDEDAGRFSGSAYLFGRNQGGADIWGEVAKLTASDAALGDVFGYSVSINGNTALVGAFLNDDAGDATGSAYIFGRNQGGADIWGEVAKLTASDAALYADFGRSVSISGDTFIVGAPDEVAASNSGSAYVLIFGPEALDIPALSTPGTVALVLSLTLAGLFILRRLAS